MIDYTVEYSFKNNSYEIKTALMDIKATSLVQFSDPDLKQFVLHTTPYTMIEHTLTIKRVFVTKFYSAGLGHRIVN